MITNEPKKPRKPRAARRNFATERAAVIQYCKLSIQVLKSWKPTELADGAMARIEGKIQAYGEILKQFGEAE